MGRGKYKDRIIHITVAEEDPERFDYQALSNEDLNDKEKYLTVEEKEGATTGEVVAIVCKLLIPEESPYS